MTLSYFSELLLYAFWMMRKHFTYEGFCVIVLQAKKHQTNVESTYNLNMKELEAVLNNFKFEKANDEEKKS